MYWSRIYVLSALIWKNKHNVKTVKAYFWPDRRIGWIGLSWNFKVLQWINLNESFWDLIIYNMKIMWRDFKRIRSSRFRNIQKSAKSSNFEWSCTYTGGQVRKRVSFQDRKNENTPKFPNIEIWCSAAFWSYLRIIWVIYTVFVK